MDHMQMVVCSVPPDEVDKVVWLIPSIYYVWWMAVKIDDQWDTDKVIKLWTRSRWTMKQEWLFVSDPNYNRDSTMGLFRIKLMKLVMRLVGCRKAVEL